MVLAPIWENENGKGHAVASAYARTAPLAAYGLKVSLRHTPPMIWRRWFTAIGRYSAFTRPARSHADGRLLSPSTASLSDDFSGGKMRGRRNDRVFPAGRISRRR